MNARLFAGLLPLLLSAAPQLAAAHAFLQRAQPAVGSTVSAPPAELRIAFTEAIEPRFSSIRVLDSTGAEVDRADLHIAPDDPRLAIVSLKPLRPGDYQVVWRVVSVDTHRTEGRFSFTVAP